MTRRDAVAGGVGAIAGMAVLVGVYEARVTLGNRAASIDRASGVHAPQEPTAAEQRVEASSDEPWRAANASLADQVKLYQRRLDDNESQRKAIEKELKELKARLGPDGGAPRNLDEVDPRDLTQDDWKELAKTGQVRAGFLCPPPDWHPGPERLANLGLAPGDAAALEADVQAAQQRTWQAVEPACAKIVGSDDVARRLGGMACGVVIQNTTSKSDFNRDAQLVADIRAGSAPMPAASQMDPMTAYWLALTGESASYEGDLARDFGPETAHRVVRDDGVGCVLNWQPWR